MSIALASTPPEVPSRSPAPKDNPGRTTSPTDDAQAGLGSVPRIRRRVLVAEDNSALRESLDDLLSAEGYIVVEAEDGEAALDLLADSPVDVLLLDLAMPRIDGLELLRRIEPPPPVVVIYSAFEYFEPREVEQEVGAKVFRALRKPVSPSQLIDTVAASIMELDDRS